MDKRMKILISYDGSLQANAALKDLRRAGLPAEAEAVVMSIPKSVLRKASGPRGMRGRIRRPVRRKSLKKRPRWPNRRAT